LVRPTSLGDNEVRNPFPLRDPETKSRGGCFSHGSKVLLTYLESAGRSKSDKAFQEESCFEAHVSLKFGHRLLPWDSVLLYFQYVLFKLNRINRTELFEHSLTSPAIQFTRLPRACQFGTQGFDCFFVRHCRGSRFEKLSFFNYTANGPVYP